MRRRFLQFLRSLWHKLTRTTRPQMPPASVTSKPAEPVAATPQPLRRGPQPPRSASPPPVQVKNRTERTLVVGVDFGTSTTKVVWQDLSDHHFEAFRWNPALQGISGLLLPSTVVIRGDEVLLAPPEHDTRAGDVRLSSIKLCVLCRHNPAICRCGSQGARNGFISLSGGDAGYPASAFACLLLAYIFREVETRLTARFPDDDLVFIWNIGCPMDYLDQAGRKAEWETMAGVALALHGEVSNPVVVSVVAEVERLVSNFSVPPEGDRNYFVRPEGLAAVNAFLQSPHAHWKTYAIVDVGAGTTEISFFFNGRAMAEQGQPHRPSYLADSTRPVGGGKIDLELAHEWKCPLDEARRRKEARSQTAPIVPAIREICVQYADTCCEILRHNRITAAADKQFDLFIIGGGGRLQSLQYGLKNCELPGQFTRQGVLCLQPPKALADRSAIQGDYDLLANACGLASSIIWEYDMPSEVPPMTHQVHVRTALDIEEYYQK